MKLTVGQTLHSVVGSATVIVIRAPGAEVTVTCGGEEMTTSPVPAPTASPASGQSDATLLGKRYADEAVGIELLCTKAGDGTLAVDGSPLRLKEAKPLPASD